MSPRTLVARLGGRDLALAAVLLAAGIAGLIDIRYGAWRPGPGGGNYLVPMIAYWGVVLSALAIVAGRLLARRGAEAGEAEAGVAWRPILLTAVGAALYIIGVRRIGLAVSSAVFIGIATWFLSPPPQNLARIALFAIFAAATLYGLFSLLVPVVTLRPLLF